MGRTVLRWLGFGVFLSILPLFLAIGFYNILGFEIEKAEYVPDLILVTFAVAVNALSCTTNENGNNWLKSMLGFLSIASMLVCFGGYFFLFGGILIINKIVIDFEFLEALISPLLDNVRWDLLTWISLILLALNAIVGLISECRKMKSDSKKAESIPEKTESTLEKTESTPEKPESNLTKTKSVPTKTESVTANSESGITKEKRNSAKSKRNPQKRCRK